MDERMVCVGCSKVLRPEEGRMVEQPIGLPIPYCDECETETERRERMRGLLDQEEEEMLGPGNPADGAHLRGTLTCKQPSGLRTEYA